MADFSLMPLGLCGHFRPQARHTAVASCVKGRSKKLISVREPRLPVREGEIQLRFEGRFECVHYARG